MRIKYVLGLLYLISATSVVAQHQVRGYVQTLSGEAVPYAHVVNTSQQLVTTSHSNGFFSIRAAAQDTLRFTMMGYQPYQLLVQSVHFAREVKIVVLEDSVLLPGITIFDRKMEPIIQVPVREPMKVKGVRSREEIEPRQAITFDMGNPGNAQGGVPTVGVGGSITGVFTYLYDRFSKDGKERRKYAEDRQQSIEESTYTELMTAAETAETLQQQYRLDPEKYDRLIARFNEEYPDAKKISTEVELWGLLHYFFSQQGPY